MTTLPHNPPLIVAGDFPASPPADLLARLRSRDQAALAQVARQYAAPMTRAAYLHLGDGHAAEDAVQDALLAAWDAAGRTTSETPLWPWLLGIVFNRCRKHLRSLSRRRRREQHAHEMRLHHAGGAAPPADDRLAAISAALSELAEPLRCVVILRYEQGLSVADTAAALDVPQGTVKRRCHDAIAKLRTMLRSRP